MATTQCTLSIVRSGSWSGVVSVHETPGLAPWEPPLLWCGEDVGPGIANWDGKRRCGSLGGGRRTFSAKNATYLHPTGIVRCIQGGVITNYKNRVLCTSSCNGSILVRSQIIDNGSWVRFLVLVCGLWRRVTPRQPCPPQSLRATQQLRLHRRWWRNKRSYCSRPPDGGFSKK